MAKQTIAPYKLGKVQKTALTEFVEKEPSLSSTAKKLGLTEQRLYTMLAIILVHSCRTGRINIEEILKDY